MACVEEGMARAEEVVKVTLFCIYADGKVKNDE